MTETENTDQALDFGMTDLEEQLTSDNGAQRKTETLGTLLSAGQRVKAAIDTGLPAEDFQKAQQTYAALAAAHEVIANFPTNTTPQDPT